MALTEEDCLNLQQDETVPLTSMATSVPSGLNVVITSVAIDCIEPSELHLRHVDASSPGTHPDRYWPLGHGCVSVALVKCPGGVTVAAAHVRVMTSYDHAILLRVASCHHFAAAKFEVLL